MRAGRCSARCRRQQAGLTYIWALAAVALFGLGLAAIGPQFSLEAQREQEKDLLRVGRLYAAAIASYHASSPGALKQYPPNLEALLEDTRFVGTMRHLRRLYPDPIQPDRPWGVVKASDGSIRGVFSISEAPPLRTQALDLGVTVLPPARKYSEWQFVPTTQP